MPSRKDKVDPQKYEERWSQIEARLKEYKELITTIKAAPTKPVKVSAPTIRTRSSSRPAARARLSSCNRQEGKNPSTGRKSSVPLAARSKTKQPASSVLSLSVSGTSCLGQRRKDVLSSRSSVSSVASNCSIPKLQPVVSNRVNVGLATESPRTVKQSTQSQTIDETTHIASCSLSPLVVDDHTTLLSQEEEEDLPDIKLISDELKQLLLSP